ncbi:MULTISPECIES: methylated-DNA--[protein]-cysteine S-methyltransferase [unclassified Dysgonomonas]|uniref:methylated-DNA--[protein]-cysteine S-methyltransferase n=1 Tax=unclassified Dysgonomonas TaxID=2630389 RepID=UPI0013ECDEB2|nr:MULTISPECIES: methylated-DNA--[protein]-cysteine S-methyltransferase [unclassified Dysgonomonas]
MKVYYESPVGILEIEDDYGHITALRFVEKALDAAQPITETLAEAIKQLDEYFAGKRLDFDLPLMQEGTDFQQKAWEYLCSIPYGETVSYKEQAQAIGSPKGFRAVGSANGKNNIAIIVPCHRVVNEGKGLGGYAYGLDAKRQLLALEQRYKKK